MSGREASLATGTRPRESVAVRRTLEQSVHFRDVAARDLDRLAQLARPKRLHNGERVESSGGYDAHLWIVLSGAVRISTSTAKRSEHVYAVLGPGNYFGLAAVIGKGVGIIDARAFGATELAWIDGAALMQLLDDRPALWRHFGGLLSLRLMVALVLLRDNTACALPERLVRRLLVLLPAIEATGEPVLPMTQADLARMLGTSRSRANAELQRLEAEGLIRSRYRGIALLDVPRLRALAGKDLKGF